MQHPPKSSINLHTYGKTWTNARLHAIHQLMTFRPTLPLLLLFLTLGRVATATPESVTRAEVDSMYEQARAMLEDRSIQNVESVPLLLETCVRELHPEATLLLMDVFEGKFKGLVANPEQATRLARGMANAAALDDSSPEAFDLRTEAMFRLALYLEKGSGCKADADEACQWMQKAARRGLPQAGVEHARYLMLGIGTPADPQRAWDILHEQALRHPATPNLFFYMGHMCAQGIGMKANARKAFELFRLGARLRAASTTWGPCSKRVIPRPVILKTLINCTAWRPTWATGKLRPTCRGLPSRRAYAPVTAAPHPSASASTTPPSTSSSRSR